MVLQTVVILCQWSNKTLTRDTIFFLAFATNNEILTRRAQLYTTWVTLCSTITDLLIRMDISKDCNTLLTCR